MSGNFKKEDLRIIKTYRSLFAAMGVLLNRRNFTHITVNDLCEEAQLSRTAFYTHFKDKYDLLGAWLKHVKSEVSVTGSYSEMEQSVNSFVKKYQKVIQNLLENANSEVLELLRAFIITVIDLPSKNEIGNLSEQRYRVLCNFVTGGVIDTLLWQIHKQFPDSQPVFNTDIFDALVLLKGMEEKS